MGRPTKNLRFAALFRHATQKRPAACPMDSIPCCPEARRGPGKSLDRPGLRSRRTPSVPTERRSNRCEDVPRSIGATSTVEPQPTIDRPETGEALRTVRMPIVRYALIRHRLRPAGPEVADQRRSRSYRIDQQKLLGLSRTFPNFE